MTLVNQRLDSNLKLCIQFHFLDRDVSSAHASPFSAADGRKWTAEKEEGGMYGGRRREKGGWPGEPRCDLVQFMNSAGGQSEKERKGETIRI